MGMWMSLTKKPSTPRARKPTPSSVTMRCSSAEIGQAAGVRVKRDVCRHLRLPSGEHQATAMHATYQQSWACGTAQGGRHVGVVPRAGRGSAVDTWQCQCRRCTRRGAAPAAAPLTHLLQELHTLLAEVREGLHEVLVQGVVPASAGSSHGVGSLSERRRRALRTSGGRTRASALTATARDLHRGSATVFRWDVAAVPSLHFASAAEIGHSHPPPDQP